MAYTPLLCIEIGLCYINITTTHVQVCLGVAHTTSLHHQVLIIAQLFYHFNDKFLNNNLPQPHPLHSQCL